MSEEQVARVYAQALFAAAADSGAVAPVGGELGDFVAALAALLDETRPDKVAVEQLYAHYKHPRTAILMGHARGVILLAAAITYLAQRSGRVQSRDHLLRDVWEYDSLIDTRTVDTHMRRLREKLGPASKHLDTVRGVGYRFVE